MSLQMSQVHPPSPPPPITSSPLLQKLRTKQQIATRRLLFRGRSRQLHRGLRVILERVLDEKFRGRQPLQGLSVSAASVRGGVGARARARVPCLCRGVSVCIISAFD